MVLVVIVIAPWVLQILVSSIDILHVETISIRSIHTVVIVWVCPIAMPILMGIPSVVIGTPGPHNSWFASGRSCQVSIYVLLWNWSSIAFYSWSGSGWIIEFLLLLVPYFDLPLQLSGWLRQVVGWYSSVRIWSSSSIEVRVVVRVIHNIGIRIGLQIWFIAVFIIVGNCWMLENESSIWSDEWLVWLVFFLEVISTRHRRSSVLRPVWRGVALVDIVVYIKRFVAVHYWLPVGELRSLHERNCCPLYILLLLVLIVDLEHVLVKRTVILALLI